MNENDLKDIKDSIRILKEKIQKLEDWNRNYEYQQIMLKKDQYEKAIPVVKK